MPKAMTAKTKATAKNNFLKKGKEGGFPPSFLLFFHKKRKYGGEQKTQKQQKNFRI